MILSILTRCSVLRPLPVRRNGSFREREKILFSHGVDLEKDRLTAARRNGGTAKTVARLKQREGQADAVTAPKAVPFVDAHGDATTVPPEETAPFR